MTKFIETLKSILIVLLLLSSLFLLLLALPSNVVSRLPLPQKLSAFLGASHRTNADIEVTTSKIPAAAMPMTISIQNSSGRHTVTRDPAAISAAFDDLSAFLSRALTGATDGVPLDADWAKVLEKTGIVFSFGGEIPAEALNRWLTEDGTAVTQSARDFLLVTDGGHVTLLLNGSAPMQYRTTVSAASLSMALEAYTPDGSDFAAHRDSRLDPLTPWEPTVYLPAYTAENPVNETYGTALATALDFNPYGVGTYTDHQGNTVFSETDRTLSLSTDGVITVTVHQNSLPRFTATADTPAAKIEVVRATLDTIAGDHLGDAQLQLVHYTESDCSFTYVLNGVPVSPAPCTATFDGTRLAELTITLRSFRPTSNQSRLLPIGSAAAISDPGARLTPAYTLAGTPGWTTD